MNDEEILERFELLNRHLERCQLDIVHAEHKIRELESTISVMFSALDTTILKEMRDTKDIDYNTRDLIIRELGSR